MVVKTELGDHFDPADFENEDYLEEDPAYIPAKAELGDEEDLPLKKYNSGWKKEDDDYVPIEAGKEKKASKKTPRTIDSAKKRGRPKKEDDGEPKKKRERKAYKEETESEKEAYFFFPQEEERDLSKPYQCDKCVRGFEEERQYRQHVHRHLLGEEDYSKAYLCDGCEIFTCGSDREVVEHRKSDCPIKKRLDAVSKFYYHCVICTPTITFKFSKELRFHHQELHSNVVEMKNQKQIINCPSCGVELQAQKQNPLASHFLKEGPFHSKSQCSFCPSTFKTWDEHKQHLDRNHNGVFRYTCGHCGFNHFPTYNEFVNHKTMCLIYKPTEVVETYPEGKHVSCTICYEKINANWVHVRAHLRENHTAHGSPCKICKEVYFSERSLKEHVKSTHMKTFQCNQCEKAFSTGAKLRAHQKGSHGEDRNYICNQCGKDFATKSILSLHIRFVHEGFRHVSQTSQKLITCEKCGKGIKECRYAYHKKKCHSEESYPCPECGTTFVHPHFLRAHITNIHTFATCDICGEQVKQKNMKYHILQNHTAEAAKPFVCSVCQKGFAKKSRYEEHMNIHTGARPFSCLFCSKTFACKSNSFKHMKESHSDVYQPQKNQKKKDQNGKIKTDISVDQ